MKSTRLISSSGSLRAWSRSVLTVSGFRNCGGVPAFALVVTACLLSCAGAARAAGCHVPERPVLAQTLSWDRWQKAHETHAGQGVMPASPAVVPLPCQGEVPTLAPVASLLMAATPIPATEQVALALVGRVAADALPRIPCPFACRLDRPPRPDRTSGEFTG
jgi:hypothetical protein